MESVIKNYDVFQQRWDDAKNVATDSEARCRITGVQFQMQSFDFLFGLLLGEAIFKHTDNVSKTLQSPSISAAEGQHVAELTCKTLDKIRNKESFGAFWKKALQYQNTLNVSDPVLPRKREAPSRYEIGVGESKYIVKNIWKL